MQTRQTALRSPWHKSPWMPRVLPFAIFMAFIGVQELAGFLSEHGIVHPDDSLPMVLYPIRAVATGAALLFLARRCPELRWSDLARLPHTLVSVCAGLLVFVLWINLDFHFGSEPRTFDPTLIGSTAALWVFIGFRLLGTAVIVPIMEELFWRSFFLRWLIHKDFESIPVGLFTWSSFIICSIMFGLEHTLILAGIVAGAAYCLLLYYTKSISQCVLSHAITNLALGIYVLAAGQWRFW